MRYIALLRGITVGGNNKVSMKELKACFEKAGFHDVMTYINSGNVLFESYETSIEKLIHQCGKILEKEFGFPISLALIDAAALKETLAHAPEWWGDDPESKHNAIFVIPPATADDVWRRGWKHQAGLREGLCLSEHHILVCPSQDLLPYKMVKNSRDESISEYYHSERKYGKETFGIGFTVAQNSLVDKILTNEVDYGNVILNYFIKKN